MFEVPLIRRIAIGKAFGFSFAVLGALIFPQFYDQTGWMTAVGMTLYYIFLGAFVGLVGLLTQVPNTPIRYRWWWRSAGACALINTSILFMFMNDLQVTFNAIFGPENPLSTPWVFVVEGLIFGFLCDYICTRISGDGISLIKGLPDTD